MTTRKLAVESWENRGNDDVPFGFVYFNDDARVVYANGEVRTSNWGNETPKHMRLALEFLKGKNVKGFV